MPELCGENEIILNPCSATNTWYELVMALKQECFERFICKMKMYVPRGVKKAYTGDDIGKVVSGGPGT